MFYLTEIHYFSLFEFTSQNFTLDSTKLHLSFFIPDGGATKFIIARFQWTRCSCYPLKMLSCLRQRSSTVLRQKRDNCRQQVHLLKCSAAYLTMALLWLKLSLGNAVAILVLALTLLIACLIKETENLRTIQRQLFELVESTPLERMNNLIYE